MHNLCSKKIDVIASIVTNSYNISPTRHAPNNKCVIAIILKTICNDFDMLVAIEYHSYYAISQLQQNHAAISIITTNSYNMGFNVIWLDRGHRAVKPRPCTRPNMSHRQGGGET
jgi:hypothetical protein